MKNTTYDQLVVEAKRHIIRHTLAIHAGNVTRSARTLGLQRTYLHRLLRLYDLRSLATTLRGGA